MLSAGLAEWLADHLPDLAWNPTGVYPAGTVGVYVEQLPADPDVAVAVLTSDSPEAASLVPWEVQSQQIRVRGDRDVRTSGVLAQQIYSALHGLTDVLLPDGTWLGLAACTGPPAPSAPDEDGRWQWVVGVDCDVEAVTEHRS